MRRWFLSATPRYTVTALGRS